jgi:hypothetical protein
VREREGGRRKGRGRGREGRNGKKETTREREVGMEEGRER